MGYRSNGHIWLSKKAQKELSDELKKDLKENWNVIQNDIWGFEGWKWSGWGYGIVKSWEDFMGQCDLEELDYEFIRLGEDIDDNEIIGTEPYTVFGVSRVIDIYDTPEPEEIKE